MTPRSERLLFWGTVGAFVALALWPLWSTRFPPLQDYPEQLFYAHGLHVRGDPAFDYDRYYEFRRHPLYSTFYVTTLFFAKLVPFEIAGKLSLSLYPLLVALLALRFARRRGIEGAPWGALLFFPLAFNQQYYFGNINYLFSLPLLILALLDFEDLLAGELGAWPLFRHALWQTVLFATHPLTFLVYGLMAAVCALFHRRGTEKWARKLAAPAGLALVYLATLWIANRAAQASQGYSTAEMSWMPLSDTLKFTLLMFTGMRWSNGPSIPALAVWTGIAAVVAAVLRKHGRGRWRSALPPAHLACLLVCAAGVLALPFRVGTFSYVNMRLTAVGYFLGALLAAQLRFKGWTAACLVALAGLSMVDSGARQVRVSAEVAEVLPIVRSIPPRSRVLPLVFDRDSPELEGYWFDPHLHVHDYYHILVGGGFNPYLFGSPLSPIRFREEGRRPSPGEFTPERFSWQAHTADYQYILTRGGPKQVAEYFAARCKTVIASGKWTLFERAQ